MWPRKRAWAWLCVLVWVGCMPAAMAGSSNFCNGTKEASAAAQDRLLQVASIVKAELDSSGQSMALVSRSGLALQRLGQRYSHAGVSLKDSANTPWSVRQLYFACDENRPRIFDQGMAGFVLGVNDPDAGYISIVWLPPQAAQAVERAALQDSTALQLLGSTYSANAFAFSTRYQNCNQWLAELLATAWGELSETEDPRQAAQQWLAEQDYQATLLHIGWQPLMWLARHLRWLHSDDHPAQDLSAAQFRVSLPEGIERFVLQQHPTAQRVEICYTQTQAVVHRGWSPVAEGCHAGPGDTVIPLDI